MPTPPPASLAVRAYPVVWRIVAAVLFAFSRAALIVILVLVLVMNDPPVTPPILFRLLVLLVLLPGAAAWLIGRAFAAAVEIGPAMLAIRRRGLTIEVPVGAIARVVPWALPLPGPGLSLRLASGRRLRCSLQTPDIAVLLEQLVGAGIAPAPAAFARPSVVYARAKARRQQRRWYHRLGRYPVFALGPTAVLFNTHQHIAYGGPLGEYYLLGLASYLQTFAVYWSTLTIYLVLYAAVWRGVAEGAALAAAWLVPARADGVRRVVEIASQVLYYGGVPVLLVLRFL